MTEPFHFPNGRAANNAQDLLELCEQCPDEATGFLVQQDLEKWLAYIGSDDIAECAANARQTDAEDRQKLADFLNKCHALSSPEPIIIAETPTNIEDSMTATESVTTTPVETAKTESDLATETQVNETSVAETLKAEAQVNETPVKEAIAKKPGVTAVQASASPSSTEREDKPSFFQVVAKFIVKILYRDKA